MITAELPQPPIRKLDAWGHQLGAYNFAMPRRGTLLDMGMGCGKSKVAVDVAMNAGVNRILVICPVAVLGVWRREFAKHWSCEDLDPADVLVLDKKGATAKIKAAQVEAFFKSSRSDIQVIVVNYETAWREPLASTLLKSQFNLVICDEVHRIKAPGGKASKFAAKFHNQDCIRLGLTGTPMPHDPLDLYAQFRFLDQSVYGTSFARFRNRYAICNPNYPSQVKQWINQDDLMARLHANSFHCRSEDVLDLPPLTHDDRLFDLSSKAAKVYAELERDLITEVRSGTVVASNALTKLLRLQQVTSGFIGGRDEDEQEFVEQLSDDKEQLLFDLMEDIDRPCVVFCRFTRDLQAVQRVAARLNRKYAELSGQRRDALDENSCMAAGVECAGVQIQSGGTGVDLTRANYAFYYSLGFGLGDFDQSLARLHRPGQEHPVFAYHLIARRTVDAKLYKMLAARRELIEKVQSRPDPADQADFVNSILFELGEAA